MSKRRLNPFFVIVLGSLCFLGALVSSCESGSKYSSVKGKLSFNKDVRPILNSKCIGCHGGVKKSGGLSFMFKEEALAKIKSGKFAVVPGDPKQSEMIHRIKSDDPDFRMPMNEEPLSKEEIKILEKWISQGAEWEDHWAFLKPEKEEVPEIDDEKWAQNEIDNFILARLEEEGLEPSEEADRRTLIRRVSMDLIGLPPSLEEIEAFESDASEDAYEQMVDRLLNSKHFGERWAAMWMDLARYADSKGYEKDGHREMWKFRDWLIDAFNENLPFDEFTIQQLAGDLIPEPTMDSQVATAFHRNTMNNDEGGTIDEEYRMAAVIDRVNTTWDVWQGTTFSCVQCHSHPYDPFMHKEYYEFLSFFNNSADADKPSEVPNLTVYSKEEEEKLEELEAKIDLFKEQPSNSMELKKILDEKENIKGSQLPIMQELPDSSKRITQVFIKGNRLDLGDTVQSNVPKLLPKLPKGAPANRLGLAQWLVDESNPLTSRVAVNRFWAQLFGKGIVETEEDFGSQGFKPTHPELLDWLAVEFQFGQQWDIKAFLKLIVTSATYKQSSKISPELLEKDPANYLLARGARVRLSAEQVRDQTLKVSGLLSDKMFGKSVMPYQPDGVWQTVYSGSVWRVSEGEDAYRRALYTYWRRTSPYPSMISFDSPSREVCVIRRLPTNTPLQALVTLNDPVYIEAANALGALMERAGTSPEEKIGKGYELALGKKPQDQQINALKSLYEAAEKHIDSLAKIAPVAVNDSIKVVKTRDEELRDIKLETPLAIVANAILNLNEFTTKH
jgi:hypothetical protein